MAIDSPGPPEPLLPLPLGAPAPTDERCLSQHELAQRIAVLEQLNCELEQRNRVLERENAALRQRCDLLVLAFDGMADGIVIRAPNGSLVKYNRAVERILGLSWEQINGLSPAPAGWHALTEKGTPLPADFNPLAFTVNPAQASAEVVMGIRKPSGELTWSTVSTMPMADGAGSLCLLRDITAAKQAQDELRDAVSLLQSTLESIDDGIVVCNLDGTATLFNNRFLELWKIPAEIRERREQKAAVAWNASQCEDPQTYLANIKRRYDDPDDRSVELLKLLDGRTIERRAVPYKVAGQVHGVVWNLRDVSERTRAEEQNNFKAQLLNAVSEAVIATDREGLITYLNPAAERLFGWWHDEAIGRKIIDLLTPSMESEERATIESWLKQGGRKQGERVLRRRDGSLFLAATTATSLQNAQGEHIGTVGVSRDITDLRRAEQELRNREVLIRNTADALPCGVGYWTKAGRCLFANRAGQRWASPETESLEGKSSPEVFSNEIQRLRQQHVEAVLRGEPQSFEYTHKWANGEEAHIWAQYLPHIVEGEVLGFVSLAVDVTQRRRDELARARLAAIVESASEAILSCSPTGIVETWNRGCERLYGYRAEEIIGQDVAKLVPASKWTEMLELQPRIKRGESIHSLETIRLHKDGRPIHVELTLSAIKNDQGVVVGIAAIARDISERKRAQEATSFQAQLLAAVGQAVIATDPEGRITYCNRAAEQLYGWSSSEVQGQPIVEVIPSDQSRTEAAQILERLQSGQGWHGEFKVKRRDGRTFLAEVSYSPIHDAAGQFIGIAGISQDISGRKTLEAQLRQAQKMEVLGRLAGGVAHDFNNILQATLLSLAQLACEQALSADGRALLHDLEILANRAVTLTAQLLTFARRQAPHLRTVDLNSTLDQVLSLIRRLLGEQISIQVKTTPSPLFIEADPVMLDQMIMNLCINARDAMAGGGRLTLSTDLIEWTAQDVPGIPNARPGTFACLTVQDTGCGMSPEQLEHLFEPFFTTKETGRGTGLGLAAVDGIVHQHQGLVTVNSVVGEGSTFRVYLPWSEHVLAPNVAKLTVVPRHRGTETLLVVEDEEILRNSTGIILERQGYRVLLAANGQEALRIWTDRQDEIALIISDMVMPGGLSGLDLAAKLHSIRPSVKLILTSGYSEEILQHEAQSPPTYTFLAKPFWPQVLLDTVRRLLD